MVLRASRNQTDRFKIVQQIEVERIDGAVRNVRTPHPPQDRVAVRRRAFGAGDADRAGRACGIFHDHGLAQRRPHRLRHDPPEHVG
jgi:hypothetical protein